MSLIAEIERRARRASFSAESLCFGPQLRAVTSTAGRKVLRCGRRAGKTYGIDVAALLAAREGKQVLYVTLTRANAKEIAWADLMTLNEDHALGGVTNLQDLHMRFPATGGIVQLRGANNERETAKIRGKKFHIVIVDEAQSIPDRIFGPLIREIIGPTLIDYSGSLWLVGTPPPVRAGLFWECYAGKHRHRWEQHFWTVRENEKLPARIAGKNIDDILRDVREENGWTDDDPTYRREYLGEDVEDLESLLFQFRPDRNSFEAIEPGNWSYVLGVDIGFDDSDAIAVLGWREHDRRVYLLEEHVQAGQDITDLAERIKPMVERYKPTMVVIDQGGLGKKTAAELSRRHGIVLQGAEKERKGEFIKIMNADLRKGLLMARADSIFAEDCKLVRRDPAALARGLLQELPSGRGGYHSDICDAVLYAWRWCWHYLEQPERPKPNAQQRLDAWEQAEIDRVEKRRQGGWLDDTFGKLGY